MSVSQAYNLLYTGGLIFIGTCLALAVVKSIIGPRISDRLMTVGTVGTLVTGVISILAVFLDGESYLVDICLIYVLISFLSVVVFTDVYVNEYLKKKKAEQERKEEDDK